VADDDPFRGWDKVDEVVVGEVMTALLGTAAALDEVGAQTLLTRLVLGNKAEPFGYPVQRVKSADLSFGIDCHLATPTGARPRTIGVAAAHAVLTGGHVLQAAAHARIVAADSQPRRRWSYYSARPGFVDVQGKAAPEDLARAFLETDPDGAVLDLAAVAKQVVDEVNEAVEEELQGEVALHSAPLTFRWVARVASTAGMPVVEFVRRPDRTFQVNAVTNPQYLIPLARFCEDVALHSWLLSTMTEAFRDSTKALDGLGELGSALEFLGHLWSPGEALDERLMPLWKQLEKRLYMSRGWQNQVAQVRDKIALLTLKRVMQQLPSLNQTATDSW
jgi:hypothetical protein